VDLEVEGWEGGKVAGRRVARWSADITPAAPNNASL